MQVGTPRRQLNKRLANNARVAAAHSVSSPGRPPGICDDRRRRWTPVVWQFYCAKETREFLGVAPCWHLAAVARIYRVNRSSSV